MLENIFHLKENHTDVKTEIMAGITTFMTMAYILAVNPNILSASGMDSEAVLIATALASFVGTALMALLANYPFALAPGMGLNAYFSYTVVLTMGYSWQLALMAVFVEGIIFIVLSLTNVREGIFNAIPMTLKSAVSVGIGLFVAFVGLQNAKLIVNSDSTLVTYQHFKGDTFSSVGMGAILALLGIVITAILLVKKVNGGKLLQPRVVDAILGPEGEVLETLSPVCKRQVLKPETSQIMREMMEAVVLYGGGRNARIAGYRVGGKSGTSQKLDSADEKARIASFVAVAPIDDPRFLCLVCLDEPHSWTTAGGSLSAPVCAEVLEQTLVSKGIPRAAVPEQPAPTAETAADLPEDGDSFDGA